MYKPDTTYLSFPLSDNNPCNLCDSDDLHPVRYPERYGSEARMVVCRRCGLGFLNPRWSADDYSEFYLTAYRQLVTSGPMDLVNLSEKQRLNAGHILQTCSPFLPARPRVLDIGSSTGTLLHVFQKYLDADVLGIEPSEDERDFAAKTWGITSVPGILETFDPQPRHEFDVVFINQTLNHLLDPRAALNKCWNMTSDHGHIFLQVQNFPEFARLREFPIKVDHTYYFGADTLVCLLRRCGFQPVVLLVDTLASRAGKDSFSRRCLPDIHIHVLASKSIPLPEAKLPDGRIAIQSLERTLNRHRWSRAANYPLRATLRVVGRAIRALGLRGILSAARSALK